MPNLVGGAVPKTDSTAPIPAILNIVVCYRNGDEITRYIDELDMQEQSTRIVLCIVLGDETNRETFEAANPRNLHILVCEAHDNLGYMRGAALGYRYAKSIYGGSFEWVIVSNSDITYENSRFMDKLLSMDVDKSVGCIGPDIRVPSTGEHQNPALVQRMSPLRILLYIILFSFGLSTRVHSALSNRRRSRRALPKKSGNVYMVHGAYFILREDVLRKMEEIPYQAFLYSEELYVAEILRIMTLTTFYTNKLRVIHDEHSSTSKLPNSARRKALRNSYAFIFKQFYMPSF